MAQKCAHKSNTRYYQFHKREHRVFMYVWNWSNSSWVSREHDTSKLSCFSHKHLMIFNRICFTCLWLYHCVVITNVQGAHTARSIRNQSMVAGRMNINKLMQIHFFSNFYISVYWCHKIHFGLQGNATCLMTYCWGGRHSFTDNLRLGRQWVDAKSPI